MKRIVFSYVFRETLTPFGLGILVFTTVLLLQRIIRLIEMIVNKGVPPGSVLKLILYLLPYFFVFTIPMALLLAVLVAFSRLQSDSEITALKASGLSLGQLLPPVFLLATLCYIVTTAITLAVLPYANHGFRNLLYTVGKTKALVGIKERVFIDDFEGIVLYVDRMPVKSDRMDGVLVLDQRSSDDPFTIVARTGTVLSDPETLTTTLRLRDGSIHRAREKGRIYQKVDFELYDLNLNLGNHIDGPRVKKDRELTIGELYKKAGMVRAEGENDAPQRVEIHSRFAMPVACFVFALLGVPLALQPVRSSRSVGFPLSIAVFALYYVLQKGGEAMGAQGKLPALASAWAPNVLIGSLAVYLLWKRSRDAPVVVLDWLESGIEAVADWGKRVVTRQGN